MSFAEYIKANNDLQTVAVEFIQDTNPKLDKPYYGYVLYVVQTQLQL